MLWPSCSLALTLSGQSTSLDYVYIVRLFVSRIPSNYHTSLTTIHLLACWCSYTTVFHHIISTSLKMTFASPLPSIHPSESKDLTHKALTGFTSIEKLNASNWYFWKKSMLTPLRLQIFWRRGMSIAHHVCPRNFRGQRFTTCCQEGHCSENRFPLLGAFPSPFQCHYMNDDAQTWYLWMSKASFHWSRGTSQEKRHHPPYVYTKMAQPIAFWQ